MTIVMGWDLFEDIRSAQEDLLRLTGLRGQRSSQDYYSDGGGRTAWMPTVDISERKDGFCPSKSRPRCRTRPGGGSYLVRSRRTDSGRRRPSVWRRRPGAQDAI